MEQTLRVAGRGPGLGATRRGFLAGIGVGAAAQVVPGGWRAIETFAADPHPCTPNAPGARVVGLAAAPGGTAVWRTDSAARTITEHRGRDLEASRSLDVGGAPVAIAITPSGRRALVITAAYDEPALALVDLRGGRLVGRVDVGREPVAVAVAPDGRTAVVAGGGAAGTLTRVDVRSGHVHAPVAVGRHPRGVAVAPDGRHAYVALNGDAAVGVVALRANRLVQRFATPPFPSRIAVSPDARTAFVTHDGAAERRVTPIDLVTRRVRGPLTVGADPGGVAFAAGGRLVVVAETGAGSVSLLDGRTGRRRHGVHTGGCPRAVAAAGSSVFVADWQTGALTRIGMRGRRAAKA